ncbi:tetratricopeptide repeat protein [Streptomyces indicus]|uniref:Tetratricopeptide (TPR) repeat n=1 Tax=Streptomyces indicus TaxID=417292 RepID=A0A1G9AXA6_9ACTN|nr:tetratricopeptide repeat protein [Streptomyces indicus]SDK31514.1 Tetratricopeptide (TPR) repeat [Streptomyces indicus]
MPTRERNRPLTELLAAAGWSGGDLARAVNRRGRDRGLRLRYDRTSVAHWLTGSMPRPPVPELVAAVLTEHLGRTVTPADAGLGGGRRDDTTARPVTGARDALEHLVALCRRDDMPAYGEGGPATPYVWTHVPQWSPPDSASPHAPLAAAPVREMVDWFARMLQQHGGGHLRGGLLGGVVDGAGRLLVAASSGAADHCRLVATAQLVHLLGDVTEDACRSGLAQRYYWHALALARAAGDSRQYAITLRVLSVQALRRGHLDHAQALIDAGLRALGPGGDAATRSFLFAGRAEVLSRRGRYDEALGLLDEASAHQAEAPPQEGPFAHYSLAALQYQHGAVRIAAGRHEEAITWLDASLARRPPSEHRAVALTHARIARSHLATGGLDAACRHWSAFLEHYPQVDSAAARAALDAARRDLTPYLHHARAREVLRRLPRPAPAPPL